MICFFFAGALLMAYAEDLSLIPYANTVLGAAATLVAAFVGARYAFKLQLANLENRATKDKVESGNRAIFELIRTYNQFLAIRNQFIDEHRENQARHLLILPMAGNIHVLQLNFDELAFLFDSESPDLLGKLAMLQQRVASTIDVIAQRSRLHIEVFQPAVERLESRDGRTVTFGAMEQELGPRNTKVLKMLTDYMVSGVDEVLTDVENHISETHAILKNIFSEHRVIKMLKP